MMRGIDLTAVVGGLAAFVVYLVVPAVCFGCLATRVVWRWLRRRRQARRFYRGIDATVEEWSAPPG